MIVVMFSDSTASIMCIAAALGVLLVSTPSSIVTTTSYQNLLQLLANTTESWLTADNLLIALTVLFSTQIALIWLLHAYCDCPYTCWLEAKVLTFWLCTLTLLYAAVLSTQLLLLELVGLTSFRLISHYLHRAWAIRGATIAVTINKLTDLLLMFLLTKLYWLHLRSWMTEPLHTDIILLALSGKSILLLTWLWLPDAMEGPTPVSTLLHSATLVITGLMIYTRNTNDIALTPMLLAMTAGATITCCCYCLEADTKKICATSTCIMIALLWLEAIISPTAMWQQALTHGYYKSSLFCLLSWLLVTSTTQDIRRTALSPTALILLAAYLLISSLPAAWSFTSLKTAAKYFATDNTDVLLLLPNIGPLLLMLLTLWAATLLHIPTSRGYHNSTTVLAASTSLVITAATTLYIDSLLHTALTTTSCYSTATTSLLLLTCMLLLRHHYRILTLGALPLTLQHWLLSTHIAALPKLQHTNLLAPRSTILPLLLITCYPPPI